MQHDIRVTSGRRLVGRARRSVSLYLLGFLLTVAIAPHRHLNSFEDLLSEGPSDSGIFIESAPPDRTGGTRVQRARLVDDDPCMACFHSDYVASAQRLFVLNRTFTPLREIRASAAARLARRSFSPPAPPPRAL